MAICIKQSTNKRKSEKRCLSAGPSGLLLLQNHFTILAYIGKHASNQIISLLGFVGAIYIDGNPLQIDCTAEGMGTCPTPKRSTNKHPSPANLDPDCIAGYYLLLHRRSLEQRLQNGGFGLELHETSRRRTQPAMCSSGSRLLRDHGGGSSGSSFRRSCSLSQHQHQHHLAQIKLQGAYSNHHHGSKIGRIFWGDI